VAFEENGPRDLRSGTTDELQDLRTACGTGHKWQPSLLPAVRQALVTRAPSAAMAGRRSHDDLGEGAAASLGRWIRRACVSGRQTGGVMADGRRERETELQGHGTENEEKEMIQRGVFAKQPRGPREMSSLIWVLSARVPLESQNCRSSTYELRFFV